MTITKKDKEKNTVYARKVRYVFNEEVYEECDFVTKKRE